MLQIIPYEGHVRAAPIGSSAHFELVRSPFHTVYRSGSPHPDGAFLVLCKNSSVSQMNYSISVPTNMSSADRQTADEVTMDTMLPVSVRPSVAVEKFIVRG